MLYLCATPIGNLEDITLRTLNTLKQVDLIAAEDTRHSRILLDHYGITTPLTSYHEHNKYEKAEQLVAKMLQGMDIACITDAGTPGISDPGEELVRQALAAGIKVSSLPGPTAMVTALTMSGLPTRRFCFEAFLPGVKRERKAVLEELKTETRTIVLYEAPHRLKETLKELLNVLGDREVTICRELTKCYEEAEQTTLSEAAASETEPRGEYVLVLRGRDPEDIKEEKAESFSDLSVQEHLERYLAQGMDRKEAMKRVAADRNVSRKEIYNALISREDADA